MLCQAWLGRRGFASASFNPGSKCFLSQIASPGDLRRVQVGQLLAKSCFLLCSPRSRRCLYRLFELFFPDFRTPFTVVTSMPDIWGLMMSRLVRILLSSPNGAPSSNWIAYLRSTSILLQNVPTSSTRRNTSSQTNSPFMVPWRTMHLAGCNPISSTV